VAYRLKANEPVPEAVRRIVREELKDAADQLSAKDGRNRDEAIHEARKSIKKVRAVLRMMEGELGPVYSTENVKLRDLGRALSRFRDAGAMMETLDNLKERFPAELDSATLDSIRRGVTERKQQSEESDGIESVLKQTAAALRAGSKRVRTWPLSADGFDAMAQGLEKTYRRGRKALARAQKEPLDPNYHEWRKRAKDLWYHVRLLEHVWEEFMQAQERSLKELETWLGDDHNLVVLRERILAEPEHFGDKKEIEAFLAVTEAYQHELRQKSESLGSRIYAETPRGFRRRMENLWRAWRAKPELEPPKANEPGGPPEGASRHGPAA
jgi:CHAD domain-containing protein